MEELDSSTDVDISFGEVAFGAFGDPFGDGGAVAQRVDFGCVSLLDFHCVLSVMNQCNSDVCCLVV